jgi:hypothetical protein
MGAGAAPRQSICDHSSDSDGSLTVPAAAASWLHYLHKLLVNVYPTGVFYLGHVGSNPNSTASGYRMLNVAMLLPCMHLPD